HRALLDRAQRVARARSRAGLRACFVERLLRKLRRDLPFLRIRSARPWRTRQLRWLTHGPAFALAYGRRAAATHRCALFRARWERREVCRGPGTTSTAVRVA